MFQQLLPYSAYASSIKLCAFILADLGRIDNGRILTADSSDLLFSVSFPVTVVLLALLRVIGFLAKRFGSF